MLYYQCQNCKKMVQHPDGPHWLDNGTQLRCPECGHTTIVCLVAFEDQAKEKESGRK